MITNSTDFKQAVRFGVELPGYYVSKDGKVFSTKKNKFISLFVGKSGYLQCSLSLPIGIFEDHTYYQANFKRKTFNITQQIHRLVAETFLPIDEYPPISIDDWKKTPETAKQFIRDSAVVDHIEPDLTNNKVENLRWVTPKQNNTHRKKQEVI